MFNNVGKTIRYLSIVFFILGIIFSFIAWLYLLFTGVNESDSTLAIISFVVLVLGIFASWVNCILLYGFGELIENSKTIANNTRPSLEPEPFHQAFGGF